MCELCKVGLTCYGYHALIMADKTCINWTGKVTKGIENKPKDVNVQTKEIHKGERRCFIDETRSIRWNYTFL